jgi:hypothetical protein
METISSKADQKCLELFYRLAPHLSSYKPQLEIAYFSKNLRFLYKLKLDLDSNEQVTIAINYPFSRDSITYLLTNSLKKYGRYDSLINSIFQEFEQEDFLVYADILSDV